MHEWTDGDGDGTDGLDVHHVQPYEAAKSYRCPGCDHEIRPGEGHKVVVPRADRHARRHWHNGCWHRAEKQRS